MNKAFIIGWIQSENAHTMKRKERKNKLSYIAFHSLERLHYNSKMRLISARHAGLDPASSCVTA
jgi:hypothetical protein